MTLKIISQNFTINANMVEPALEALKKEYPAINRTLSYDEPATNLQFLLFVLGYHCRVKINSSIFTISQLCTGPKIENEDPIKTLTILSTYMSENSYITVDIDGKEQTFKKEITNTTVPSIELDIKPEIVELKDTDEIVPKVISKKTKRVSKNCTDAKYKEVK